jgi:hypothetical protein
MKTGAVTAAKRNCVVRSAIAGLFLLATALPLPAPIIETPATTPAPEQAAKPKPKRTIKSKVTNENSDIQAKTTSSPRSQPTPNQTPFVGTWVGTTNVGDQGDVEYTLSVNADGSTVTENTSAWGSKMHPAKWDGVTLKWPSYFCQWTLTPSADGQTAQVIIHGPFTSNPSPTYRKQSNSVVPAGPITKRSQEVEIPTAKPVPGRPGFVYNPFNPNSKLLLDVKGKASGTKVKDPTTGQIFIVP